MESNVDLKNRLLPADADILPPGDDRIFKVLLTHPNAKQVLIDVISTVIERKVVDVQIRNNELPAMDTSEKNERLDVNCTIDTGDQVNVEMHCYPQDERGGLHTNFINKYVYFLTDLHSSQKSVDVKYRKLAKTYQITFCMYNVFSSLPDYVNWFSLRTEEGFQLTDQINMVVIELDKIGETLNKPVEKMTSVEKWSLFLRFAQEPVYRNKINDIIKDKEEIGMAAALLREISQDEHERARQRSRKMWEMDMYTAKEEAKELGHEEGYAEGHAEGHAEGIVKGHAEGLAKGITEGHAEGHAEGIVKGHAEAQEENRKYFLSLLNQGLSIDEIKQRLTQTTTNN